MLVALHARPTSSFSLLCSSEVQSPGGCIGVAALGVAAFNDAGESHRLVRSGNAEGPLPERNKEWMRSTACMLTPASTAFPYTLFNWSIMPCNRSGGPS
jgi:hypothetical protein